MFFLCSVYVLVYVLFVFFVSIICVRPYFLCFFVFFCANKHKETQKNIKNKAIRKSSTKKQIKHKQKINKTETKHKKHKQVYATFVFCLCFVCVSLVFFMYVKILRSYFPRIRS